MLKINNIHDAVVFISLALLGIVIIITGVCLLLIGFMESALFISVQIAFAYILLCLGIAVLLVARDTARDALSSSGGAN